MSNRIQVEDIELYTSCCVERKEREVQKRENGAVFIGKYQISFAGIKRNEYQRFDFPQTGSKLPNLTVAFNYLNRVIRAFIYSFGTDTSESYFPSDSSLVSILFRFKFLLIFRLRV